MSLAGIEPRIVQLAEEHLGLEEVDLDDDLVGDLGVSPKALAEFLREVCQEYEISMEPGEYPGLGTLRGIAALVDSRV